MSVGPDAPSVLNEIVGTSSSRLELGDFLDETLKRACAVLDVDTATVLRHVPDGRHLVAIAAVGIEEEVFQGVRVPIGVGFAGKIAVRREPVVIDHVDETTVTNDLLRERGLHTMLGVPMLAGPELIGVLHVGSVRRREFTGHEIDVVRLLAERLAVAVQLDVYRENRAATIALQNSLLPGRLPEIPGLAFGSRYVPGAETGLGGDWYDLFKLPGDRVGVVMGDVSGHGLDAAVIMGRLRSALRAYALDCDDPAEVLAKLDRKADHFEHGVMATVAYGVLDAGHRRMRLSLAGHLPPVLAVAGAAAELVPAPPDPPIGLAIATGPRRTTTVELAPDSVFVLYTDGLVERRDRPADDGIRLLTEAVTVAEPDHLCARIMASLIGSRRALDDVALLVLRRTTSRP